MAALAGAAIELRRDLVRGLILVALPVALFAYLSFQARYFGRWLLPAYPALAMLAAVALVRAVDALPARRGRCPCAAWPWRPCARSCSSSPWPPTCARALVLGREDTRVQARDWLVERYPPELRVAIEPAVPGRYYRSEPRRRALPAWLTRCPARDGWPDPGFAYAGAGGQRVCVRFKPGQFARPDGGVRASAYHLVLSSTVIDDYRRYGYCLVMTLGRGARARARDRRPGRARPTTAAWPGVTARARVQPLRPRRGSRALQLRPLLQLLPARLPPAGADRTLYRLRGLPQGYGPPLIRIPKVRELPPFAPRDEVVSRT